MDANSFDLALTDHGRTATPRDRDQPAFQPAFAWQEVPKRIEKAA